MRGLPLGSLLHRIEQTPFEHAIFLTYSIDIPFVEASVIRHLLRRGCRNVVIFADAFHVAKEIHRLGDLGYSSRSWNFGQEYSLTGIHHTSAFHPKVAFLVGEEIEVIIGSGNLEPGGLRANLEVLSKVVCGLDGTEDDEARGLVPQVWQYITRVVAKNVPSIVMEQMGHITDSVPWITQANEGSGAVRLVTGPGNSVIDGLSEAIGNDDVHALFILSPFFDAGLDALRQTIKRLHPRKTILLIQPNTVSIPGDQVAKLKHLEAYTMRISESRYAHAKLLIAECGDKSVLLAGSHNVSKPAFDGENFEASLLRIMPSPYRFSERLGLSENVKAAHRLNLGETPLVIRHRPVDGLSISNSWLAGAQLDGSTIEVSARRKLKSSCRLVFYLRSQMLPALPAAPCIDGDSLRFRLRDAAGSAEWSAVAVKDGGDVSAPVPLMHVRALAKRANSSLENRIRAVVSNQQVDASDLPDLLKDFGALLIPDMVAEPQTEPRVFHRNQSDKKTEEAVPGHLRYEDFVIPWRPSASEQSGAVSVATNLEIVVGAIARAVGGVRRYVSRPELVKEEIQDHDAELADRSIYREEALADCRIEKDPTALKDLEYDSEEDEEGTGAPPAVSSGAQSKEAQAAAKLKSARRIKKWLNSFAELFPRYVKYSRGFHTSLEVIEKVTSADRLLTALVSRKVEVGDEAVELLEWATWTTFQISLLDALSADESNLLTRFSWDRFTLEHHRQVVERFVGYLGAVLALCQTRNVDPESRSFIRVGLLRVSRILGVDQGFYRTEMVIEATRSMFDAMKPDFQPPASNWTKWVNTVGAIRARDAELRIKFRTPLDIIKSGSGSTNLSVGDWVWCPGATSHVAIVTRLFGAGLNIACEPGASKDIPSPSFLVRIGTAL